MKRVINILFIAALTVAAGCNAWLDKPRPKGQQEAGEMFATRNGFRDVLTGAYINMASGSLYGGNTSMILPELLAQNWSAESTSGPYNARVFDYESAWVKNTVATCWRNYFLSIVNLNSLLAEIDAKRGLFSEEEYEMIKGEALGLRAFLHLEVLRLWGPVPAGADLAKEAIPYVRTVTNDPAKLVSIAYGDVLKAIVEDLDEAEKLLENDPITKFGFEMLNAPSLENVVVVGDEFYFYRHSRFNLYAAKATKARYYLWIGEKDKALKYAEEVIDAVVGNTAGKVFTLGDENYLQAHPSELMLLPEHIFSVYNDKLLSTVQGVYNPRGTLSQTRADMNRAYESYVDDIRWKTDRYWRNVLYEPTQTNFSTYMKYFAATDRNTAAQYVPLIRLSEMHLIATECAATSKGGFDAAGVSRSFEPYRTARNIDVAWTAAMVDGTSALERLEKEYRKDFFGEGQMFFFYKRHGQKKFTWPVNYEMDTAKYVLPKPDGQSKFE